MEPEFIETTAADDAEKTRRTEIRTLVRSAGLDAQVVDELIDSGADPTRAKTEVFDAVQAKPKAAPTIRSHAPANDDPATLTRARLTRSPTAWRAANWPKTRVPTSTRR